MRITTTDGRVYERPDMCGYCSMDTGGNHQFNCPCYQPLHISPEPDIKWEIEWEIKQTIKPKIRIRKYDDEGNFLKELQTSGDK